MDPHLEPGNACASTARLVALRWAAVRAAQRSGRSFALRLDGGRAQ